VVTAYKKADGVVDAVVDYQAKTCTVTFDPAKTSVAKLVDVLKGTKYSAVEKKG